jgi:hypothetical protein
METKMADAWGTDEIERLIAKTRNELDAEIAGSGALARIRDNMLRHASVDPLAGLHWQRIAAAVLIAGMLGGAIDLILPESRADPVEVAIIDPLYDYDQPEAR